MTTLNEWNKPQQTRIPFQAQGAERRAHRRHDLEHRDLNIDRWDGARRAAKPFGRIVDLSAGGVRIRTEQTGLRVDQQVRVRIELPEYAGIAPFVDTTRKEIQPKREWVGWLAVSRVQKVDTKCVDVAGRLMDMDELDRGMLSLYLSTQPMAA